MQHEKSLAGKVRAITKLGRQHLWMIQRDAIRKEHELQYVFWECTINCNFLCKHCGSNAGGCYKQETVSTEEIKEAFRDIAASFDARKIAVAITGGEPLLRADLFEVMTYASSLGFRWGMVTNGFMVTKEVVEKARQAGMKTVDVSIDGIGETHDMIRGVPGAFERATQAARMFVDAGYLETVRITTTINAQNIVQLDEMHDYFSSLGVSDWRLLHVDPIGRAECNASILLSKEQTESLLRFIKTKREEKSDMGLTTGCAHYLGEEYEDEVRNHFFYCATGINIGTILHNGDIYVCPNVPRRKEFIQGNIKTDSFSEVWNTKFEFFRDPERTLSEKCKGCEHWKECLGGSLHSYDFDKNEQKVCLKKGEQ